MPKKDSYYYLKKAKLLAKERDHLILTEKYENVFSECVVFCQCHHKHHVTTFGKYKNTKWGCYCCAQASRKSSRSIAVKEKNFKKSQKQAKKI